MSQKVVLIKLQDGTWHTTVFKSKKEVRNYDNMEKFIETVLLGFLVLLFFSLLGGGMFLTISILYKNSLLTTAAACISVGTLLSYFIGKIAESLGATND